MDRFVVDLQQFGDRYSIVWLEVNRLIEALPQSPGERELRPVRDAIVRLNDRLEELTQLVLRLETISLMFAGNLSERDAYRLAQHRRSLFNSEPRTRAAAQALIARLPRSSTPP